MKITLKEENVEKPKSNIFDFPPNKLGVIRSWGTNRSSYVDLIVIWDESEDILKSLNHLINKDDPDASYWVNWTNKRELLKKQSGMFIIEVLKPGAKIEIEI